MVRGALVVAAGLCLGSCAAAGPEVVLRRLVPLELALTADVAVLQTEAAAGSAPHQLALAVVYENGLRGRSRDPAAAADWAGRAFAQRGWTPITTYTPAYSRRSSRVGMIQIPRYGLSPADRAAVAACVRTLVGAGNLKGACGAPADEARFRTLWRTAGSG